MELADRLISSTTTNLDAATEWPHAHDFYYRVLLELQSHLPIQVQQALSIKGRDVPSDPQAANTRAILWQALEGDQLGNTASGAGLRAALFAFSPPSSTPEEGPLDSIAMFVGFAQRAGASEGSIAKAFTQVWRHHAA